MTSESLYPCGRISRRGFLHQAAGGFLGVAMGGVWAQAGALPGARLATAGLPRANSVIFLFMCGGVSHIDTFDPKDNKWAGKLIDAVGFGDNRAAMLRPVIPCHRTFTRYGKSGIPVSDWFPHVGGVIHEIGEEGDIGSLHGAAEEAVLDLIAGDEDAATLEKVA